MAMVQLPHLVVQVHSQHGLLMHTANTSAPGYAKATTMERVIRVAAARGMVRTAQGRAA